MNEDSYLDGCQLKAREGEIIFHIKENGEVLARLRGYTVIPTEDYERLSQLAVATRNI